MAKKYKSAKLVKQPVAAPQKPVSAFGKLANRLADSKKKKIQKLSDTQKRLLESKKNNKMIKVSKKAKKFALLDEDDPSGYAAQGLGLTHRGINVRDLKEFDDVNFNQSDLQNDEEFDNLQEKMNFAGFEATQNLLQEDNAKQKQNRPKNQSQIYKQIIEKSKAYKMLRQQQHEQNFNKANELDEGFDQLLTQLKFRNKDQQLLERIEHRDLEYDKLMNELKEDERIVSNKVVQKSEKVTEKIRKKKNEQLNKLMKDSDGEDDDIRGWVDHEADSENEEGGRGDDEDEEQQEDYDNDGENDDEDNEQDEGSYDELDEVDLSSEEEDEQNQEEAVDGDNEQENDEEGDQQVDGQNDEQQQQDNEGQDDQDDQEQDQESQSPLPPPKKNNKQLPQTNKQTQNQSRQNPQKKVKLNFIQ